MKSLTFAAFLLISMNCFAQPATSIDNNLDYLTLKPAVKAGSIYLQWAVNHIDNNSTWEIQASLDGKSYKTIGYVWGAENENTDNCIFKQAVNKLPGKFNYYRVKKEVIVNEINTMES